MKVGVAQTAGRWALRASGFAGGKDRDEFVRPRVHAVDGVSFTLDRGEVFGLVGESGCGKTTTGRTVLRLIRPTGGRIVFEGADITNLAEKDLRPLRRKMQIIFQDPHAALNPSMTIGHSIQDPLLVHGGITEQEAREAALAVMEEVGLAPADDLFNKYPADLSGGQKQRAVIARAVILKPSLLVADEPVAMLDMSIRARILELLLGLKRNYGLTYLFITHDLATAKFVCDRIAIMYLGRIVETGPTQAIFRNPKHPYTKALLAAIPGLESGRERGATLPRGEVPDAIHPPAGCRFHPRCPVALPTCGWEGRDFVAHLEERGLRAGRIATQGAGRPVEEWRFEGLVAEWRPPPQTTYFALGSAWFVLSVPMGLALAAHIHALSSFGYPLLGPGLSAGAAAVGMVLSFAASGTAAMMMLLRPESRRVGPMLVAFDLLFSLYGVTVPLGGAFLAALLARVPLEALVARALAGPAAALALTGHILRSSEILRELRRVERHVRTVLADAPSPLVQAVEGVSVSPGSVLVKFREPAPLSPKDVEGQTVECLLY